MSSASQSAASSASSVPACALRRVTDMKLIDLNDRNILVTGSLGFIGASLIVKLLKELDGCVIVGMDDLSTVDESLRMPRVHRIERAVDEHNVYTFAYGSINDKDFLEEVMRGYEIDVVVNLAGRAGVRQSIDDPVPYIDTNIVGFHNVLEVCVDRNVKHLVYASSSSVYGNNGGKSKAPFSEFQKADEPVSLYAATKRCDELLAYAYASEHGLPCTGLRFFTVYGPDCRPDMLCRKAADKFSRGESVEVYNKGSMSRDFTYIDDVVDVIFAVMGGAPRTSVDANGVTIPPWSVYNVGYGNPIGLIDFLVMLFVELQRVGVVGSDQELKVKPVGMQVGDVRTTYANTYDLKQNFGIVPETAVRTGLHKFADWYAEVVNEG